MKRISWFFPFILLAFTACSSAQKQNESVDQSKPTSSQELAALPGWIEKPYEFCLRSRDLCVVGEGESYLSAEREARRAMAEFFRVEITGEQTITKSSRQQNRDGEIAEGDSQEYVNQKLQQKTEEILEGVEMLERFEKLPQGIFYALAKLDKKKTADLILQDLEKRDAEIREVAKKQRPGHYKLLARMLGVRESLHKKFTLLSQKQIPAPLSVAELEQKKTPLAQRPKFFLQVKGQLSSAMSDWLKSFLVDQDWNMLDRPSPAIKVAEANFQAEELHLKVNGFLKYQFQFVFSVYNEEKEVIGQIELKKTAIGRSQQHAFEQIQNELMREFEEKFYQVDWSKI